MDGLLKLDRRNRGSQWQCQVMNGLFTFSIRAQRLPLALVIIIREGRIFHYGWVINALRLLNLCRALVHASVYALFNVALISTSDQKNHKDKSQK